MLFINQINNFFAFSLTIQQTSHESQNALFRVGIKFIRIQSNQIVKTKLYFQSNMQAQRQQSASIEAKISEEQKNKQRQVDISNIIFNEFKNNLKRQFTDQSTKRINDISQIRLKGEKYIQESMEDEFFDESSQEQQNQETKQKGDTTNFNELVHQSETQKQPEQIVIESQTHNGQSQGASKVTEMLIAKIQKVQGSKLKKQKSNKKEEWKNETKAHINQVVTEKENKRTVINEKLLLDIKSIFDIMKTHDLNARQTRQVFQNIVQKCGFSIKKVIELWKQYKFDPKLNNSFHKVKNRYSNNSERKEFDITKKRIQFIKAYLSQHPLSTTKQICQAVQKEKQLCRGKQELPPRTIRRLLKMINWEPKGSIRTYQKINRQQAIQARLKYAQKYCELRDSGANMYFVFELQFPLVKKKLTNEEYPHIMVALNRDHIFGFQLLGSSFKRDDHMNFLEKIYAKIEKKLNSTKCYLMIDNPRIQDYSFAELSEKFKANIQVIRLPPGITVLNPASSFLLKLKNSLLSQCEPKDVQTLGQMIKKIKSSVTAQFLKSHYEKVQSYIQKALKQEPF